MKRQFIVYIIICLASLVGCSPKISVNLVRQSDMVISNLENIKVFDIDENVPLKSNYIGMIKVGEAGMTVNCGYDRMILECRKEAQKVGANIVKLIKVKSPDPWSSCYRIEAKLYSNESIEYLEGIPVYIEYTSLEQSIIKLLQGLRQGEFNFFNAEGYYIVLYESSRVFNDESIKCLKNKFKVDKNNLGRSTQLISFENIEFTTIENLEGLETTRITYLFRNSEGFVSVLELNTSLSRLVDFENTIVNLVTNNKLPNGIFASLEADSIQFANRYIKLGPFCRWMDIRNIQCPKHGQMDWSEFSSRERAEDYINQRINLIDKKRFIDFRDGSDVSILFEGTPVTAKRFNLKIMAPKMALGVSNNIIIYYVVAQVEDEYIACILSHYDNDQNTPGLPPLLNEVMKLNNE